MYSAYLSHIKTAATLTALAMSFFTLAPVLATDSASTVLGQIDYATDIDNTFGTSAGSLSGPMGVFSDESRVYVADTENNRVLIYDIIDGAIETEASIVLGQEDFVSNEPNRGSLSAAANTLWHPTDVHVANGFIYVVDQGNHRVLLYLETVETGGDAQTVLGQDDFDDNAIFNTGYIAPNKYGFASPTGIYVDDERIFVADTDNHRVLMWYTISPINGQEAYRGFGQFELNQGYANRDVGFALAETLSAPYDVVADGTNIYVTDSGNNRVLVYDYNPTDDGALAEMVLGQDDFFKQSDANRGGDVGAGTLSAPTGITIDTDGHLVVADSGNNRVLSWNIDTLANGVDADEVFGQSDFVSNGFDDASASSIESPQGVGSYVDGDWFVATGNRVLGVGGATTVEPEPVVVPEETVPEVDETVTEETTTDEELSEEAQIIEENIDIITDSSGDEISLDEALEVVRCNGLEAYMAHRAEGESAVYYITPDCTKRAFVRSDVFFTYFESWDDVVVTDTATLGGIADDTLGFMPWGPLYDPQYGALVKTVDDPKVYLLLNDEAYWITDEAVFNALNYQWDWIEDVDNQLIYAYSTGDEIDYTDRHPNYTLVKYADDPKVYRLEPDADDFTIQVKRHIVDEAAFAELGFRLDRIVTIDETETYPDGPDLTAEG